MKIVITWLHKDGKCRSWTNATPVEVTEKIDSIIKRAKEGCE